VSLERALRACLERIDWRLLEQRARRACRRRAVVAARQELLAYDCDGLTLQRHQPPLVVLPESTEQVAAAVRCSRQQLGVPFVARGSGTGLSGGAVGGAAGAGDRHQPHAPACWRSTCPMSAITVQPGVINSWVTRAVAGDGFLLRPRSLQPGGLQHRRQRGRKLRWGALPEIRRHQQPRAGAWRWCCPMAASPSLGGGLAGDAASLDLRGVFIGSEGTLGIATAITLRLLRAPESGGGAAGGFQPRWRRPGRRCGWSPAPACCPRAWK
jgi:glycolate oxidase